MHNTYPENYMITSGGGEGELELVAFDAALIDANLANYNLLRVSSILPIKCQRTSKISKKEGAPLLTAYGSISSNVKGELIASAVAVGVPKNKNSVGVIMEYSGKCSKKEAENTVRKMVNVAMANHNIQIEEIVSSAIEKKVMGEKYVSVISAVALW